METSFKIEDKNFDEAQQHSTAPQQKYNNWRIVQIVVCTDIIILYIYIMVPKVLLYQKKQLHVSNIGVQSIKTYITK